MLFSGNRDILVDSTIYHQGFYNYYAYDDGTPEMGYGLEPAGAQLGYIGKSGRFVAYTEPAA